MNLVILGPQGSGKGTQAGLLAKKFNLEHIDVGRALREVAKSDTPLGRKIYDIQNNSKTLVSSDILKEVLAFKMNSIPREGGLIFDGAPRTFDQIAHIEDLFRNFGKKIDKVIFINIPEKESIRRISKRRLCQGCGQGFIFEKGDATDEECCRKCGGEIVQRIDDTEEGVKKRLKVFATETLPVIENFRRRGMLLEVDGMQSMEKVFEEIAQNVEGLI